MSPLYIAAVLITSAFIPPSLGQGYGPLPHKGKKHHTTTTTTLPPDIASLNIDGQQYQPGFINPISSTPVPDNSLGSYNQPQSPSQGGGSYWWQNPNSPFSGVSAPSPAQQPPAEPGGCGEAADRCGAGSTPVNIQGNPFLSGLKPPVAPSRQAVACSGAGYICSPKHLCSNGVVTEDGQGIFQVRSEVQYCDATSQVCCRLPAGLNEPSGCGSYGSGGSCGGNLPAPVTPSQPGLVHVTPSPSQSGLVHVTPSPSQSGLVHVTPSSSQSGLVHVTPSPSQSGLVHVTPSSSQSGLVHVTPSSNQHPSGGKIKAGDGLLHAPHLPRPSFPASGVQHPSASIPSATYAPGNNFGQPIPGSNGVPIGGSIYDTTRHPVTPTSNQSPYTGPLNTTPHPGCAAALKCVPESYCTAEGVMADQPVTLSREQYENRVPLSDCADPDTGAIGKCCRDPNYKDPWPGGMMMKNIGDGHQPEECGAGASCLQPYQCGSQYKIQPAKSCRILLNGASGICCSHDQSAFPGGQLGGTFISETTPVFQKPVKKPTTGYPQPKPGTQSFPQPVPVQPFPQSAPSSLQPVPQHFPSSPRPYPQPTPSSPQPFPQITPSSPQPLPHVLSSQTYPQPSSSSQTFLQHIPSSPQPFQQPSPSSAPPHPYVPSSQTYPQPSSSFSRPFPHSVPSSPQPFPQYIPSSPQPSSSSLQPYPQSNPSNELSPQPTAQPSQLVPSAQPPTYTKPVKSVHPQSESSFPQPQPTQPQSQFLHPGSPQPFLQSHFPVPQPQSSQPQPQFPSRPSTGYPQSGVECGIRRQVSRQGLSDADAGFGEFPWQALVLSNSNHSALCSAAVISDKAAITAAHCLHNVESSDILLEVGRWKLLSSDQPKPIHLVQVAAIARHPNFDASSLFNDLAVLILDKQLGFDDHINKICLPPRGQDVTQFQRTCTATGWGKKALQGSILHHVSVRLIPYSTCEDTLRQTHLGRYFILNPSFQCAVPSAPSQDLCKVDVGGPIACDRGDGHYVLSGLYSWDIGCNAPNSPTVLSGIDVAWIESILDRPVDELVRDELNEILKQQQQQDLVNVDTESKPGFSQGYGKK